MKRKIVFLTSGMTAGGAERVVATLSNALAERGVDVIVAMLKGRQSEYDLGADVRLLSANLAPGLKNFPAAVKFFRKLMKEEAPDVVVSFSTKTDLLALIARSIYRFPVRLVVSDRADPFSRERKLQAACNVLYRRADAIVCQSESVANYYRARQRESLIETIPNPLDQNCIGEPFCGQRAPLVFAVGRLSQQKNHRMAVQVFKELKDSFPQLQLRIFGSGPLEAELKRLIADENLTGIVDLAGTVPNVALTNRDASLFLFTSNYEGFPNALMEAAASGIPSVSTNFSPGTAQEIISHGENGFIVPVGDHSAAVEAATKILSGALDQAKIESSARRVREKHQTAGIVDAWLAVLLLDNTPRDAR